MGRLFIGIVKNGLFELLFPKPEYITLVRLTTTGVQDSVPPENGELNLVEYEKAVVAVKGHANGGWIYSASVVDTGEPIVTALVENVFGR
ncbi:MAG: hypothetical protein KJ804_05255 [Proteobacteria bacterium]|nr:hypothetical protein [Pseudomonadota bacterium]MBU1057711.1 hypothetical protein [Pseudomonadota bacterium]